LLFNSYEFIFFFLPFVLVFHGLAKKYLGFRASVFVLVLGSFFFYAWWSPPYLLLLAFSIGVNFGLGRLLSGSTRQEGKKKFLLMVGIGFNLALLGYFKYTGFMLDQISMLFAADWLKLDVLLPIGISFYTFQQIAFLVDSYHEKTDYDFLSYCLFVSFFPQLIAGPIVHHKQMMPQFSIERDSTSWLEGIGLGIFFFVPGLFKKVVIADSLSSFVGPVFAHADAGGMVTFVEAWLATFAYSMQLYFDFSGYSDMAIGLAYLFGIQLPLNFNSPYKSRSIVEFWRRWHMTLSQFLRDYLYIPLGGNRYGSFNRYRNLMITMALGGIWHGAGWGFLIWGLMHGSYLVVNHLWTKMSDQKSGVKNLIPGYLALPLTFLAVIVAWVPFRAVTMDGALGLWSSMLGMNAIGLPNTILGYLNVTFDEGSFMATLFTGRDIIELQDWVFRGIPLVAMSTFIALCSPNTYELSERFKGGAAVSGSPALRFSRRWAIVFSLAFVLSVSRLNDATEFMYFQF